MNEMQKSKQRSSACCHLSYALHIGNIYITKLMSNQILPHLQYGILSLGFKMSRLSKLQKRAIRVIT